MYDIKPNLIFGFHGCDESVRDRLLNQPNEIVFSKEKYDWLGHGMYFWENNYERALRWAEDKKRRGKIDKPAVVGATLFLGYCCDFLDSTYIQLLKTYFDLLYALTIIFEVDLPENRDLPHDPHKDKILRELDCAVIEFMNDKILLSIQHDIRSKGFSQDKMFDSTRSVFIEGGPVYEGAGIFEKNHIQIAIRNPNCIKGFLELRTEHCSVLVRNLRFARLSRKEVDFPDWLEVNN